MYLKSWKWQKCIFSSQIKFITQYLIVAYYPMKSYFKNIIYAGRIIFTVTYHRVFISNARILAESTLGFNSARVINQIGTTLLNLTIEKFRPVRF